MITEHDDVLIFSRNDAGEEPDDGKPRSGTPRDGKPRSGNPKDRVGSLKPPLHLIPAAAEIAESIVMALGARKYGAFNWRTADVRATVYIDAARRHLAQWVDGEDNDPESGVSHLAHARASLGILIDAIATANCIDDRPPRGVAAELIKGLTRHGDAE